MRLSLVSILFCAPFFAAIMATVASAIAEETLYICEPWKKVLFAHDDRTPRPLNEVEFFRFILRMKADKETIELKPGFVARLKGTVPSTIIAHQIVAQDGHRSSEDVERYIYSTERQSFGRIFQLTESPFFEPNLVRIREIINTEVDYHSVCMKTD